MKYTKEEVMQYVKEEDVKFIRLAFCDIYGKQKNISIMPSELPRAFKDGIAFDASAIRGFGDETHSDLMLHPDPSTFTVLPWRPEHGRVVRMFCTITYPDGRAFECDTRSILIRAIDEAKKCGITFDFGPELEFYLFKLDELGNRTDTPYDEAGYMDIAPEDRGENIRREICLMLEQMGIRPESSHHEEGPGQNEIDFRYSDALTAADNAQTFETVVKTVSGRNGLWADFAPKPLKHKAGNGFHINISANDEKGEVSLSHIIAGVLTFIPEMTAFLNPCEDSYARFGQSKAPAYISWSAENRSQLVRVPAAVYEQKRVELRSPDPTANPYLAFALIIYAGLFGIQNKLIPPPASDINFFKADEKTLSQFKKLPSSLDEAISVMKESTFIRKHLPEQIIKLYSRKLI
ncbi:MAG: glutamine synthetase [Clostridia bacterium]|nr:glutamine synthetase [Clostridia bacterium]